MNKNTTTPIPPKGVKYINSLDELPPKLRELYRQCNRCLGVGYFWDVVGDTKQKIPCDLCNRNPKE